MFKENFTTKQQGNVGVSAAILYFTRQGYTVSIPLNDSQDYDLIADIDGKLNRIQVKTTRYVGADKNYVVELRSSGGTKGDVYHRVSEGSCDLLFVLTANGDEYMIPRERFIKNKCGLTLGKQMDQYKIYSGGSTDVVVRVST